MLYRPDNWPDNIREVKNCSFKNVSFSKTEISNATFKNCTFTDCLFIATVFDGVEFHKCKFVDCNLNKSKISRCYWEPMSVSFNDAYKKSAANVGVYTYQQLMKNAEDMDQKDWVMDADIKFRNWKREQLAYDEKTGKITKRQRVLEYAKNLIYDKACKYGYSPFRFSLITIILFCAISYLNLCLFSSGLQVNGVEQGTLTYIDSVFYTFSVMTALGFSTIIPMSPWVKVITVLEAFFGIVWLGFFISMVVKRILK